MCHADHAVWDVRPDAPRQRRGSLRVFFCAPRPHRGEDEGSTPSEPSQEAPSQTAHRNPKDLTCYKAFLCGVSLTAASDCCRLLGSRCSFLDCRWLQLSVGGFQMVPVYSWRLLVRRSYQCPQFAPRVHRGNSALASRVCGSLTAQGRGGVGWGGGRAPFQKKGQLVGPQNMTKTDPDITGRQNSEKANMTFSGSTRRGDSENPFTCHVSHERKKIQPF